MPESDVKDFDRFVRKLGTMVADEIDKHVKSRMKKLKTSNDSLRSNLEAEKAKAAGAKAELDGQVQRARSAEAQAASLTEERNALQVELDALREVHAKTEKEKSAAEIRATKAEQALKARPKGQ